MSHPKEGRQPRLDEQNSASWTEGPSNLPQRLLQISRQVRQVMQIRLHDLDIHRLIQESYVAAVADEQMGIAVIGLQEVCGLIDIAQIGEAEGRPAFRPLPRPQQSSITSESRGQLRAPARMRRLRILRISCSGDSNGCVFPEGRNNQRSHATVRSCSCRLRFQPGYKMQVAFEDQAGRPRIKSNILVPRDDIQSERQKAFPPLVLRPIVMRQGHSYRRFPTLSMNFKVGYASAPFIV